MKSLLLAVLLPTFVLTSPSATPTVIKEPPGLDETVGIGADSGLEISTYSQPHCKSHHDASLLHHEIIIGEELSYPVWSYHLSASLGDDQYLLKYEDATCLNKFEPEQTTKGKCVTFTQQQAFCLKVVM